MRFGSWIARSVYERVVASSNNSFFAHCDAALPQSPPDNNNVNNNNNKGTAVGISSGSGNNNNTVGTSTNDLKAHNKKSKAYYDLNWDHCEHEEHGKAIHQIILIRHGQYHQVPGGDEKHTLTPLGHQQAGETGQRLAALLKQGHIHPIRRVYYSTQTRATQTWQDIRPMITSYLPTDHNIRPCSMIREGAVCKPNPSSTSWKVQEVDFIRDQPRVEAAFLNYFRRAAVDQNENYSTVFVCHGNVIRYLVMRALQLPPEAWLRTAVYNASITILEIYPSGRVSLRNFGDVGHFSPEHITYS